MSKNLSHSMRENYNTFGVENYYNIVGSSYRNPHYLAVKQCLFLWMNKWWAQEGNSLEGNTARIFDLACGSGEVTEAIEDWLQVARSQKTIQESINSPLPKSKIHWQRSPPSLQTSELSIQICAADPFTSKAYEERTKRSCYPISFQEVANGKLPEDFSELCGPTRPTSDTEGQDTDTKESLKDIEKGVPILEMVICSFALHLLEDPSQIFALLWELSGKARWLIVIAPHKKPEIKDGWGWMQWDIGHWKEANPTFRGPSVEILRERVHLRAFKSQKF